MTNSSCYGMSLNSFLQIYEITILSMQTSFTSWWNEQK